MPNLTPELLDILRCPLSKSELVQNGDCLVSTDPETRRSYPIVDGFPVMLVEESTELTKDEWSEIMDQSKQT